MLQLPVLLFATLASAFSPQDHDVQRAPFDALRWNAEQPEVRVEGSWYGWLEIDELAVEDLIAFCQERWPGRWQKRVGEDLVEAMLLMGHEPEKTVRLELFDLESGKSLVLESVSMTRENRNAVRDGGRRESRPRAVEPARRVERKHGKRAERAFRNLATPWSWEGIDEGRSLSRAEAEQDLDQLEWAVENTHSYRDLTGVDYRAAFDAVRLGLGGRISNQAFAVQIMRLLALLGDGHASVRGGERYLPRTYLPFLPVDARGGVACVLPDRSAYIDADHPYVESIDGVKLERWLEVVASITTQASEASMRYRGLRNLRLLGFARAGLGLEQRDTVRVELRNAEDSARIVRELPVTDRKPIYGAWPQRASQRLTDDVGYLRITSMSSEPDFLEELHRSMQEFRETERLVIDVRGNGGGSRDALRVLLPYVLEQEAGPHVVNVASYRLRPGEARGRSRGYLENRDLHPQAASHWSAEQQQAIEAVARNFTPDWTPRTEDFSAWHYFLITTGRAPFHYTGDVLLLIDTGCFSATDIFAGAFSGLPNVTLIGTPTGGGSGRSRRLALTHSGVELRLSTMASFRPDGSRYDGKGIAPDVLVEPVAEDFLAGGTDTVLEAALDF